MQAVQNASASQGRVHVQSTVSLEEPPPAKAQRSEEDHAEQDNRKGEY